MNSPHPVSIAPPWLWVSFILGVLILLVLDLFVLNRKPQAISFKSALRASAIWVGIALLFNLWFGFYFGAKPGTEFITGYLIEECLSIDNLFLMFLIFESFRIPQAQQHRILFYGILGAIVMRGALIVVGVELIQHYHWVLYFFGAILFVTAIRFLGASETQKDLRESRTIRWLTRILPLHTGKNPTSFFIREQGQTYVTSLFLALAVIEVTDLVFALDSIPAVFAVTQDSFIAFGSNILAILGLRSLYFVLARAVAQIRYLRPGLAAILGFIGVKMLLMAVIEIPEWVSLLVIVGVLSATTLASAYSNRLKT